MSMHPDLEWLARNVAAWPEDSYWGAWLTSRTGQRETSGFHGWPKSMPPKYHTAYTREQWLQARQDLGLVMSESEEQDYAPEPDMVNNPPHYTQGGIECIEAIRAALTDEEFRGYCKGNSLKYIWRERHKGGNESLQKAVWYMRELEK